MSVLYYMVLLSYSFLLICSGRVDYGDKEEMYDENIRLKKVNKYNHLFPHKGYFFLFMKEDFIVNHALVIRGI